VNKDAEERYEDAINAVRRAKSFRDLCKKEEFNVVRMLYPTVHENDFTRLIMSLCDIQGNRAIAERFVMAWLGDVLQLDGRRLYDISAECNWRTPEGRFLDLLIKISPRKGSGGSKVIGIEAKINASESGNQLRDYQNALAQVFKGATQRALVFLTLDGRYPMTHEPNHRKCPCHILSYSSVAKACLTISGWQGLSKDEKVVLEHLASYIDNYLGGSMTKTGKLIAELLKDPETKLGIERIQRASTLPTMRSLVYEKILPTVRRIAGNMEVAWHYPGNEASPGEFNFKHEKMPQGLYYMLCCAEKKRDVRVGDEVSFLVMMYSHDRNPELSATRKAERLVKKVQWSDAKGPCHQWGPWACLWAGAKYRLQDLDDADAEALAGAFKVVYGVTAGLRATT
jgi:hypothetical protein